MPTHLGSALALAHFLERTLALRPARTADAPAWFDAAVALVQRTLAELTRGAAQASFQTAPAP